MDELFPSHQHRKELRNKVKISGYSSLDNDEKRSWHAYNYAWERHFVNNTNTSYAMDPRGEWYDARLVERAQRMLWPRREPQPRNTQLHESSGWRPDRAGGEWRSIGELLGVKATEIRE